MAKQQQFNSFFIFVFCLFLTAGLYAQPNPFGYNNHVVNKEWGSTSSAVSVQKTSTVNGNIPKIVSITAPDTIVLPSSGTYPFEIQAIVTDADSLNDVDSVWFCSRKSSYPDYRLFLNKSNLGYWFIMVQLSSQNRADTYPFVFFAKDKAGNLSDSLVHYVTLIKSPTAVKQDKPGIPASFKLMQNFPNPFNPVTNITYSISAHMFVTLKVYDLFGKEVAVLVNQEKAPGDYNVKFDASSLSSGMYLYELKAGAYSLTRKLILMK